MRPCFLALCADFSASKRDFRALASRFFKLLSVKYKLGELDRINDFVALINAHISGGDLVVAFNLAAPDGGPALRSLDDPNYVMVRKVSSFRRESPWQR